MFYAFFLHFSVQQQQQYVRLLKPPTSVSDKLMRARMLKANECFEYQHILWSKINGQNKNNT